MDRLKHALVELAIASVEEIEEAVARQQLYGGDLLTNLLEVRSFTESQALGALEHAYGMTAVAAGPLPSAPSTVLCRFDRQLLLSVPAYPLEDPEHGLALAVGGPVPDELNAVLAEQDIRPGWRLAVPVRIQEALCRDLALPLERRLHKAVARLEGNEIFNSSRAPNPLAEGPRFSQLPRPQSLVPGGFFADWNDNETPRHEAFLAETAPQPSVVPKGLRHQPGESGQAQAQGHRPTEGPYHLAPPGIPSRDLLTQRSLSSKPASRHVSEPSRRGPYSLAQARRDLAAARTAEQVLRITFTYTIQFFDFLAAFTVREGAAYLKRTRGLPDSIVSGQSLALSECALLARAANECRHLIVSVSEQPALRAKLGLASDRRVAVLSIAVRQRTAILLVGGFDVGQPHSQHLKEAAEAIPFVSHALERIILKRKSRPPQQ